jgi:hypothetical protein
VSAMNEMTSISRDDITDAVRNTALLADLSISMWSAERTDAKVSTDVRVQANAIGNTGRYVKNRLAGADGSFKACRGAYAAARLAHYGLTLPWGTNGGARLLPNLLFQRYLSTMSDLKREAKAKRDLFVLDYPDLVTQAIANLGGLANPADYPSAEEVRDAFKLEFDFIPIPTTAGFAGLPDAVLEKLGDALQARQLRAVEASQAAMWERVRESVGHLADRLVDGDGRLHKSAVEAVRELITLLPGFDFSGDPRVHDVVTEIQGMLTGVDVEDIRKHDATRQDVLDRAKAITSKLDGWGL